MTVNSSTWLRHPDTGVLQLLVEGDDVPEWAEEMVGDHLLSDESGDDEQDDDEQDEDVAPSGNAPLEDWQDYARSQGASEEDLAGKGRNDLRDEFGS